MPAGVVAGIHFPATSAMGLLMQIKLIRSSLQFLFNFKGGGHLKGILGQFSLWLVCPLIIMLVKNTPKSAKLTFIFSVEPSSCGPLSPHSPLPLSSPPPPLPSPPLPLLSPPLPSPSPPSPSLPPSSLPPSSLPPSSPPLPSPSPLPLPLPLPGGSLVRWTSLSVPRP